MSPNETQLLRNPDLEPNQVLLCESLKEAYASYFGFMEELNNHSIEFDYRYYSDGKAWLGKGVYKWNGKRGGQNEKTIFWLSIWEGFYKLSFFIPEKNLPDYLNLELDDNIKQIFYDSKLMGKTLRYYPIIVDMYDNQYLESIFSLIDLRINTLRGK